MKLLARQISFSELTPEFIVRWKKLEHESIEPNAFLSPHFIIPAVRWLTPDAEPSLVIVEEFTRASGIRLLALGLIVSSRHTYALPIRHFNFYNTIHTFKTGLLISPIEPKVVLRKYLRFLLSQSPRHHALKIENITSERSLFPLLHDAAQSLGISWFERSRFDRPVYRSDSSENVTHKSRCKDIRRNWKKLSRTQAAEHHILVGDLADEKCINRHLHLENMGWKGANGTSMLSSSAEENFFREMAAGFMSEGRLCMSEIQCNGNVIASSSNFLSGHELFAFKTGWDPSYAKYGPGLINELALSERCPEIIPNLLFIDSGTEKPSFVDRVLPHRTPVVSGYFAFTDPAKIYLRLASIGKIFKKYNVA